MDNIKKYHDQISYEIERELKQIYKFNFGNAILERMQSQKPNVNAMIADVVGNIRKSKKLDESFHSTGAAEDDAFESEEVDEFQDAHDYFDPEMVD